MKTMYLGSHILNVKTGTSILHYCASPLIAEANKIRELFSNPNFIIGPNQETIFICFETSHNVT